MFIDDCPNSVDSGAVGNDKEMQRNAPSFPKQQEHESGIISIIPTLSRGTAEKVPTMSAAAKADTSGIVVRKITYL